MAWLDDWQISARLAKLSTNYSYQLIFCEKKWQLPDLEARYIIIIDMDSVSEKEFNNTDHFKNNDLVFIIGYAQEMDTVRIEHFRALGYDMVMRRQKLLKNLDTILKKIIYGD